MRIRTIHDHRGGLSLRCAGSLDRWRLRVIRSEPNGSALGSPERDPLDGEIVRMSFQAYLDSIKAKTGKTPEQIKASAVKAGAYRPDMKATELIAWLAKEYDLGRGHSMAIWAVFKSKGWVNAPKKSKK